MKLPGLGGMPMGGMGGPGGPGTPPLNLIV